MSKFTVLGLILFSSFLLLEAAPSGPNPLQDHKQNLENFRDLVNGDFEGVKNKKKPKKYKCFAVEDDEELTTMPSGSKDSTVSVHKFVFADDEEAAESAPPITVSPSTIRHVHPTIAPRKQESFKQVLFYNRDL